MRVNGHNVLAIGAAAIAIYAIEFLIYGMAVSPEHFQDMSGMSQAQANALMGRMPVGVVMPILAAIGLSLAIKWRAATGAAAGAMTGLIVGVLIAFSSRMYGFVYGPDTEQYLLIDLGRYVVTYGLAGAVIGAWK